MKTNDAQNELDGLLADYRSTEKMSEAEACRYWNTDSKAEILSVLKEEISYWTNVIAQDYDECEAALADADARAEERYEERKNDF